MKNRMIIIDAANVVGAIPNGWWRDRLGATERLRDQIAAAGPERLDGELVLVVEGKARGVRGVPGVRVVAAARSGDDAIVDLLAADTAADSEADNASLGEESGQNTTRSRIVVTADRELRRRVMALGAATLGPGTFLEYLASGRPVEP